MAVVLAADIATGVAKCAAEAMLTARDESFNPAADTEEEHKPQEDLGSAGEQDSNGERAAQGDHESDEEQSTTEEQKGTGWDLEGGGGEGDGRVRVRAKREQGEPEGKRPRLAAMLKA